MSERVKAEEATPSEQATQSADGAAEAGGDEPGQREEQRERSEQDEQAELDDLLLAQKRLGHVIERAGIGEDRQLARSVRDKGEAFANIFYGTLRMTRLYDLNNETFNRPLGELAQLSRWLLDQLGVMHLVTVEQQVYLNDIRIRFKAMESSAQQLGVELRRHNVGGISIFEVLSSSHMLQLLAGLAAEPASETERRTALCAELSRHGVKGIELTGVNRYLMGGEEGALDQDVAEWQEVLGRAVEVVEEMWNNAAAGRVINPLSLRRAVVELLAAGVENEGLWADVPGETEHGKHAVQVARVALAIGSAIGLSDKGMQDLGVAALAHDVGYAAHGHYPSSKGKPSLAAHLSDGALVMLRQRGFHDAKLQRILASMYHHHDYIHVRDLPSLFARIVRLAEDFDNLTSRRGGGRSPAAALALMASGAGSAYDPLLMRAMINRLGRYPPGTRLKLADGRVVRTLSLVRENNFDKPRVRTSEGRVVELAAAAPVQGIVE
jgi:hypothetical protein